MAATGWQLALTRMFQGPLDSSEVYESLADAQTYAKSPTAYGGQLIKVLENDKYEQYILQPSADGFTLEKPGVDPDQVKQYVQVVDTLPTTGMVEGILYINTTDKTGSVWKNAAWVEVFSDVQQAVDDIIDNTIGALPEGKTVVDVINEGLAEKADIAGAEFTGEIKVPTATVNSDGKVAVNKEYVEQLINGIVSFEPGIVDSTRPLPTADYKVGQSWRVAEEGVYAGQACETGDLIICVNAYTDPGSNSDFIVLQANIDGAVTSTSVSTNNGIAIFDGTTGKIIKDSGVTLQSLTDAINKVATLEQLQGTVTDLRTDVDALKADNTTNKEAITNIQTSLGEKANAADVYTKAEADDKFVAKDTYTTDKTALETAINNKADSAIVTTQIETAVNEAKTEITETLNTRIGEIPESTDIKSYIDTAVGSGGSASAEAIAKAKQEAIDTSKAYTDDQLALFTNVVEF